MGKGYKRPVGSDGDRPQPKESPAAGRVGAKEIKEGGAPQRGTASPVK